MSYDEGNLHRGKFGRRPARNDTVLRTGHIALDELRNRKRECERAGLLGAAGAVSKLIDARATGKGA